MNKRIKKKQLKRQGKEDELLLLLEKARKLKLDELVPVMDLETYLNYFYPEGEEREFRRKEIMDYPSGWEKYCDQLECYKDGNVGYVVPLLNWSDERHLVSEVTAKLRLGQHVPGLTTFSISTSAVKWIPRRDTVSLLTKMKERYDAIFKTDLLNDTNDTSFEPLPF